MRNFVDPIIHPASPWTGSPSDDMVKRAAGLETGYFACTDHGSLSEVMKTYKLATKKGMKFIPGIEIYFRDDDCPLARNTDSETLKYFHLGIHFKTQEAYHHFVWVQSQVKRTIKVREHEFPLFGWAELEDICRADVTLMCTNYQSMVAKHLLVDQPQVAVKYYERLKYMRPGDFYTCIVPTQFKNYWRNEVIIKFKGVPGTINIPADQEVETNAHKMIKARWLAEPNSRHTHLNAYCYNSVRYEVRKEIEWAKVEKNFSPLNTDLQHKANMLHKALAKRYDDPCLVTSYAYYDHLKNKLVQDMRLGDAFRHEDYYQMRSYEEVEPYLKQTLGMKLIEINDMVVESYKWAEKFDNFKFEYDYSLPECDGDPQTLLVNIMKSVGRMKWDNSVWVQRFKHELETIRDNSMTNLIPYFFPIRDVMNYYEEQGELVGPGRGSAGASLISYCMGITQVDPMLYELPFSRFLSTKRINKGDFPDIDVDLPHRDLLVGKDGNSGYLYDRWGDKACQISTRTMMRLKSAIKDVNRFKNGGHVEEDVERFAKSLETPPQGMKDRDFVFGYEKDDAHVPGFLEKSKALQKYVLDRPDEWEVVERCLGIARQSSRHASAFIIADKDLRKFLPLMNVNGVRRVSAYEADEVEKMKLIKYDFLVVQILKDLGMAIKLINERHGDEGMKTGWFKHEDKQTYIWDLPVDHAANELMWKGQTYTTWQTNTTTMLPYVKAIKPGYGAQTTKDIIMDYATILALVRPGPLDYVLKETGLNMAETYVELRFGRQEPDIDVLVEYLPETYGVIVFQEQITKLANELAEMPVDDAEDLRKFMCKKKKVDMLKLKPSFIAGAAKKVGDELANKIWDRMETFAQYGFSIIHSVEYAHITYANVFIKKNYPLEWWTAVLTNAPEKEIVDVFWKYVRDMVMPPDINLSTEKMAIDYHKKTIRSKLSMVEGISNEGKTIRGIIDQRPYADLNDFVRKKVCGQALAKKLTIVGVLDSLYDQDATLEEKLLALDQSIKDVQHEEKLVEYAEKVKVYEKKVAEHEEKKKAGTLPKGSRKPGKPKEPIKKPASVDEKYLCLTPVKEYQLKKMIMPSMNLDLRRLVARHPVHSKIKEVGERKMINFYDDWKKEFRDVPLISGNHLQNLDEMDVTQDITVGVCGYVIDAKEFTYHQTKKAFKITMDCDGYINEKIIWGEKDTNVLRYDREIKKGAVCTFIMQKRAGKKYTNIKMSTVEYPSIGKI